MKKKINGLSNLTVEFIKDRKITFSKFLSLFQPYVKTEFRSRNALGYSRADEDWEHVREDGTKYKNRPICVLNIKVKKKERKKIKRILSSNQTDNLLTFFYHIEYDEEGIEVSREMHFRNSQMYRIRDFRLYDFLYEMRKLLPNLIIDLEITLMESL
jgi:hypothetical protein